MNMGCNKFIALLAFALAASCTPQSQESAETGNTNSSIDERFQTELALLGFESPEALIINERTQEIEDLILVDDTIFFAGGAPITARGEWIMGAVQNDADLSRATNAVSISCIRALHHIRDTLNGDLGRIKKILNVRYYVAAPPSFKGQSAAANGCSNMLVRIFGDDVGRHTRTVMGVNALGNDMMARFELTALIEESGAN